MSISLLDYLSAAQTGNKVSIVWNDQINWKKKKKEFPEELL